MPRSRKIVLVAGLALGALAMFFPFVWTFVTSLSSSVGLSSTPSLIPRDPSFDAYRTLFENTPFARVILNSVGIAVVSTALQLTTAATAAYAFARLRFRGRGFVFALYLGTMMIPGQVLIVPLFSLMRNLGLVDTYLGAILPGIVSTFGVFLLRQAMTSVPTELDEAARIDGAGHFRIFTRIILPLVVPTLATLVVFSFMGSWNSFLWPLVILRSPELHTLPLALSRLQGQFTTEWDVVMAGSIVSIIPMLLIYITAQKYVIQGAATSGIK